MLLLGPADGGCAATAGGDAAVAVAADGSGVGTVDARVPMVELLRKIQRRQVAGGRQWRQRRESLENKVYRLQFPSRDF